VLGGLGADPDLELVVRHVLLCRHVALDDPALDELVAGARGGATDVHHDPRVAIGEVDEGRREHALVIGDVRRRRVPFKG